MTIREIQDGDEVFFAKYARAEDVAECLSVSKCPLEEHIAFSRKHSVESYCLVDEKNRPLALYGVIKEKDFYGVWLLTTVFVEEYKLSFMKEVRNRVKIWYNKYGPLYVITDLRYKRAVKLNEWAGFKRIGEVVKINGLDFGVFCCVGSKI